MKKVILTFVVVGLIVSGISMIEGCSSKKAEHSEAENHEHMDEMTYTCPMHPEVKSNEEGKCPKCGMTLVAKKMESEKEDDHDHKH